MTEQAKNSLQLYRGGNPETIKALLRMQRHSVVEELREHFGCTMDELPIRLSIC